MTTLKELLTAPGQRANVVTDCVQIIDEEVKSKGGISGLAIKGAYAVVKTVKPGFIAEAVDHMLDDFVARLEPFYEQAVAAGQTPSSYMASRPGQVADGLLSITDERAANAKNQTVKKAYEKLRPSGKNQVEAAVPRIGRLIDKYTAAKPA
jgi:hypothetical protein